MTNEKSTTLQATSYDERTSKILDKFRTTLKSTLDTEVEALYQEIVKIIDEQCETYAGAQYVPQKLVFKLLIARRAPSNMFMDVIYTGNTDSKEFGLPAIDNRSEVYQADLCAALISKLTGDQKFAEVKDKKHVFTVEYDFRTLFGL